MDYKLSGVTFVVGLALGYLLFSNSDNHPQLSSSAQEEQLTHQPNNLPSHVAEPLKGPESTVELDDNHSEPTSPPESLQAQLDALQQKTNELEQENEELRKGTEVLLRQYAQEKQQRLTLQHQLGAMDESEISDEQMRALVNKPYDSFMLGFRGNTRDRVYDYFNQPEDLENGFQLQTQIADFIQSHSLSSGVQLDGVTCKKATCEIRVFEKDKSANSWHIIWNELVAQPFWQFNTTHSSSKGAGNEQPGHWLFIFAETFDV